MKERLFTEREVADLLNISLPTLRKLRDEGKIAYLRLSDRTIRYREIDINKYLAECRVKNN